MGSTGIDLSAGLVPKPAPAPPSGIDLSAGLVPAASPAPAQNPNAAPQDLANSELAKSGLSVGAVPNPQPPQALVKGGLDKFQDKLDNSTSFHILQNIGEFYPETAKGAVKEAGKTLVGADNLIRAGLRKVGVDPEQHPSVAGHVDETDFGLPKDSLDTNGAAQWLGGVGENIAEWMYGEGEVKAVTDAAEKYKNIAKVIDTVKKYPKIAATMHATMEATQQALLAGTQTLLKTGGDSQAASDAAVWTAGLSILIHAGSAGLVKFLQKRAATSEMVGGRMVTVPADVRNVKPTPTQAEGAAVYADTARESARGSLESINTTREPQTMMVGSAQSAANDTKLFQQARAQLGDNASISEVAKRAQELKDQAAKVSGADTLAEGQRAENARRQVGSMAATVPESVTGPRNPITSEVGSQAGTIPESVLGPKTTPQPRVVIGGQKPNSPLPKINVNEALNKIHDFTGAADTIETHAQAIYQKADELSEGAFKQANDALRVAQKAKFNAVGKDSYADALGREIEARNTLDDVIKGLSGKMSSEEIAAARTAFRQTYVLRDIANSLDSSLSGIPGSSNRANAYRGFNGNQLMTKLSQLTRQMGRGQVESVIGAARLQSLERIAELNRTNAQRAKFGAAVEATAKYLVPHVSTAALGGYVANQHGVPWELGAAGGFIAGQAGSKVMKAILANPRLANNLIYAIEYGARPEHYGPMLATEIQRIETENSRDEQARTTEAKREDKP